MSRRLFCVFQYEGSHQQNLFIYILGLITLAQGDRVIGWYQYLPLVCVVAQQYRLVGQLQAGMPEEDR